MSARITVNVASTTPPYDQIRSQIASLIAGGALETGARLPTVRSLASDLGVAPGTVARAYKELEASGLIESRRRNGTVVLGGVRGGAGAESAVPSEVSAAVAHLIETARRVGMDGATVLRLVDTQLAEAEEH